MDDASVRYRNPRNQRQLQWCVHAREKHESRHMQVRTSLEYVFSIMSSINHNTLVGTDFRTLRNSHAFIRNWGLWRSFWYPTISITVKLYLYIDITCDHKRWLLYVHIKSVWMNTHDIFVWHACCVRVGPALSVRSRTETLHPLVLSVFFFSFYFENDERHAAPMVWRETKKKRVALLDNFQNFKIARPLHPPSTPLHL